MNLAHATVGQLLIPVSDFEQGMAWYRDVLGIPFLFSAPPQMAFFDCGGVRLMLSLPEQEGIVAGQQFSSVLYYTVDDIQQAAAVLTARGVVFEAQPHVVARLPHADLWMGFFRDPSGNVLALMSEVAKRIE